MKLFIIYNLHEFILQKKSGYDDFNIFTKKNGKKVFTFSDLEFAFSKKFYYLQNQNKFKDLLANKAYDLKRIKSIKSKDFALKKEILKQAYNFLKQKHRKNKIIICDEQEYTEICDKFFTKTELVNKKNFKI